MSKLVDTNLGQFRQVEYGDEKRFLFECPICGEMLPMDEEILAGRFPIDHESRINGAQFCTFKGTHDFGKHLVVSLRSQILVGEPTYHEERGGTDAEK